MKEKIQIIQLNNKEHNLDGENSTISKLNGPQSFDRFDINVIDLSSTEIWSWDKLRNNWCKFDVDLNNLNTMILNSKNSINLLLYPQNIIFESNRALQYLFFEKNFNYNYNLYFEKNFIELNGKRLSADFCFDDGGNGLLFSEKSHKPLVIQINERLLASSIKISCYDDLILLLKAINIIQEKAEVPIWLEDINFLDDLENKKIIEEQNKKIFEAQKIIDESYSVLENNNKIKSILYSQSQELVDVVLEILTDIFSYDFSSFEDLHIEDFQMELDDSILIGEIKGVKSNVKNEHVSQVENHSKIYLDKHPELNLDRVKPILIINHQREKHPKNRDDINERQISLSEHYGVLIIETVSLLKVYEEYKLGNIDSEKIKNYLLHQKGLLNFEDLI